MHAVVVNACARLNACERSQVEGSLGVDCLIVPGAYQLIHSAASDETCPSAFGGTPRIAFLAEGPHTRTRLLGATIERVAFTHSHLQLARCTL